ncbi:MAG: hypothetical protein QOE50_287 [Sphingomonadales bacterium]|jgi:hypothetical protein|nr:hypothetical protein [Sphingomonadales bacterium]
MVVSSFHRGETTVMSCCRGTVGGVGVSPALMLILGGAVASATPAVAASAQATASPPAETGPNSTNGPPAPARPRKSADGGNGACQSQDTRNIIVCGQRRQGYRIDPSVTEANREADSNSRSATSATPAAQAVCAASPMGCGKGLEGLDLANVAVVAATMGVRAVKGKDWARAFKTGGTDEYQLYQQAKQRREAEDAERAAAKVKMKAREAESEAHAAEASSN